MLPASTTPHSGLVDFGCRLFDERTNPLDKQQIRSDAERWLEQMTGHGPGHIVALAADASELAATLFAASFSQGRLSVFATINGISAAELASMEAALVKQHIRGLIFYPSLYDFKLDDAALVRVFECASSLRAPIIVRCGLPPAHLRDRDGVRLNVSAANPLELASLANDFPLIPFVIQAFGAGFLRESLMVGELCENVMLGTASGGAWRRTLDHHHSLEDLFERALAAFGPERLLFSTGSGPATPGWRSDLATLQREALGALEVPLETRNLIFHENAQRLLNL